MSPPAARTASRPSRWTPDPQPSHLWRGGRAGILRLVVRRALSGARHVHDQARRRPGAVHARGVRLRLRLQHHSDQAGTGRGGLGRRAERLSAARRSDPEPGCDRAGRGDPGTDHAYGCDQRPRPRDSRHGLGRRPRRSRRLSAVPAGARAAQQRAVASAGVGGGLSAASGESELPDPAGPDRRRGEPDRHRPARLQRGGARL